MLYLISRNAPAVVGRTDDSLVAFHLPVASKVAAEKVVALRPEPFPWVPHDDQVPVVVESVDPREAGDMVGA